MGAFSEMHLKKRVQFLEAECEELTRSADRITDNYQAALTRLQKYEPDFVAQITGIPRTAPVSEPGDPPDEPPPEE